MRTASVNFLSTEIGKSLRALANSACGIDHIVDEEASFAFYVADNVHYLNLICARSALIDNRYGAIKNGCRRACARNAAYVWRNYNEIVVDFVLEMFVQYRTSLEMIYGNIEETLNLRCVEVYG